MKFWFPTACVVLDYWPLDQHMHYEYVMPDFRRLSAKSRVYCCCMKFWFPIACVALDYHPLDQHMHYGALDILKHL